MSGQRFFSERFNTPTGWVLILTDAEHRLRVAEWEDKSDRLQRSLRLHYGEHGLEVCDAGSASRARIAIEAYFAGELEALEAVATATGGTEFQKQVWAALRAIPAGGTVSYGELAARIGRPAAVRAVGAANGANPIPIVVPCHRVIGADASLTGFGGGLERKRWLLAHERKYATKVNIPYNLALQLQTYENTQQESPG
jgi:methylated-DNA-[protein]-cysteine S-methyltransferase